MGKPTALVGVTGCIAAYKACEIVRGLQKAGMRVKVVMTEHACEFVGPTTFRALTREPVAVGLFDAPDDPIHHVSLAQECDVFVIAPCTANVAAKIAHGIADDLLTTTALATTAPLVVAPAMNVNMYEAPATQENLATLKKRGAVIVEAGEGYLACGDVGRGRLAEVDDIVAATCKAAALNCDLAGRRVLVTAGPTVEPIDPVRYLSNHSSGKMGYAVAEAAARRGADVVLVSGPVSLDDPDGVEVLRVQTAQEMLDAAQANFDTADIAVFAAAVADMRPARVSDRKLKKHPAAPHGHALRGKGGEGGLPGGGENRAGGADCAGGPDGPCADGALSRIDLVENPDILATLAASKRAGQVVVGFAAETDNLIANAQAKLVSKNADMIVANDVAGGKTFGADDNQAVLVMVAGEDHLPRMPKRRLADAILDRAISLGR